MSDGGGNPQGGKMETSILSCIVSSEAVLRSRKGHFTFGVGKSQDLNGDKMVSCSEDFT